MAKAPLPGRVKTRLCPPLSPAEAADVAQAALADTLAAVAGCGADHKVVALDGVPGEWLPEGMGVVPQHGRGLDQRLANAWAATGPLTGGWGVQIGMDTPQVTSAELDALLEVVVSKPRAAVLGPATDGGWWALGLHAAGNAAVLATVPMSRPDTAERTRAALVSAGLRVTELPVLTDIDHFPDAVAVAAECPPGSRTRAVVASVAAALGARAA